MNDNRPAECTRAQMFWNFNIGHAITIGVMIVSIIGLYFKFDQRLTSVESLSMKMAERMEKMDENGTRGSQRGIYQDTEQVRMNRLRIEKLETVVSDMSPRVERIDVNLQWLLKNMPANSTAKAPNQP